MKNLSAIIVLMVFLVGILPRNIYSQDNKGNENVVTTEREPGKFDKLEVQGASNVFIETGHRHMVKVETDENLQDKLITVVSDGKLMIKGKNIKKSTLLNVYITTPGLKSITVSGAVSIKGKDALKGPSLYINASGASNVDLAVEVENLITSVSGAASVTLKGSAVEHTASVSGAGDLNAKEMPTSKANVKVTGAGDANIDVKDELVADISGAGDISLKSEPAVKIINKSKSAGYSDGASVNVRSGHGDTVRVKVGGMEIEVIDDDTVKVTVGDRHISVDEHGNVDICRVKRHKYNGHWGGFDLGVNGYLNSENSHKLPDEFEFLELRMEKSISVHLNLIEVNLNLIKNNFGFTTGLGLEWNNYRFRNNTRLTADSSIIWYGENDNYTKSKLLVNYLTVPLLFEYQTNRYMKKNSFHITAGMLLGWRFGSHTKMVYYDGKKQKLKQRDDFYLNPFKYQAMVRIGWGVINLWANYSINTLFREDRGAELYPYAIGLTLLSW